MDIETNAQHFGLDPRAEVRIDEYVPGHCDIPCAHCRHNWRRRGVGESCSTSWLAAPYGQPSDIRIPWPPPNDPNPL